MISNIAIQLNALKNECQDDLEGVLCELSELGFKGVEFCGFFDYSPAQILDLLKKYNLTLVSSHLSMEHMLDEYDEILDYHKKLQCNRIVITFGEIHGFESLSMLVSNLISLKLRLGKHDIELLYHNHEHEFKKYSTGKTALEEIMSRTTVNLELDAFWAEQGGADVMDVLKEFRTRIPLIHIKDGINHIPTAIGAGNSLVKDVYDYSVREKMEWIVLEVSSKMSDPMDAIRKSVQYINKNF